MAYLESDGSRVWAAWTLPAVNVWFGWLVAVLDLNDNGALPCDFPRTIAIILLTGRVEATQTGHNNSVVREASSRGTSSFLPVR